MGSPLHSLFGNILRKTTWQQTSIDVASIAKLQVKTFARSPARKSVLGVDTPEHRVQRVSSSFLGKECQSSPSGFSSCMVRRIHGNSISGRNSISDFDIEIRSNLGSFRRMTGMYGHLNVEVFCSCCLLFRCLIDTINLVSPASVFS